MFKSLKEFFLFIIIGSIIASTGGCINSTNTNNTNNINNTNNTTQYLDAYQQEIKSCGNLKTIQQQNNCRVKVTKKYNK